MPLVSVAEVGVFVAHLGKLFDGKMIILALSKALLSLIVDKTVAGNKSQKSNDSQTDKSNLNGMAQDEPGFILCVVNVGCKSATKVANANLNGHADSAFVRAR